MAAMPGMPGMPAMPVGVSMVPMMTPMMPMMSMGMNPMMAMMPMGMNPMMSMMGMHPMMAPMMSMGINQVMMPSNVQAQSPAADLAKSLRQPEATHEQFLEALEAAEAELKAAKERDKEPPPEGVGGDGALTRSGRDDVAGQAVEEAAGSADASDSQRCHLHPQKRPNAKCRFCQRAQAVPQEEERARHPSPPKVERNDLEDYSRRTFNCSPMLKDQIYGSTYFKSLLAITSIEDLMDEIAKYADTVDVYNTGSFVTSHPIKTATSKRKLQF